LHHTRNDVHNDNLTEDDGHLGNIYQLGPKKKREARISNPFDLAKQVKAKKENKKQHILLAKEMTREKIQKQLASVV
jgi:hypothetical protein